MKLRPKGQTDRTTITLCRCAGLYTCTVEWSVEAPVETQYRVEVLVPPSITSLAARGEVREGDTAELECQGGQHPPAGTQGYRAYLLD